MTRVRPRPSAPDLSGVALEGRYELHEPIGEGTFGRVYRGRDRRLAREVAVKVIKPWWAEDPGWVRAFEREAQLLASISDPGIVQIYDVGTAEEGLYYVAELVRGESLARRLQRGPLSPGAAREVALGLCRALARAHADRIVHRDVKPENVLLTRDGQVKIGDFGVARLAEGSSDGGATVAGTPRYMAPEQARGGPLSPATDVYGVGVVLYEMLAGHPPFRGATAVELALSHLADPPPPLPPTVPRDLAEVVSTALAKVPAERFPDAAAMAAALLRGADPGSTQAHGSHRGNSEPASPTGPPILPSRRTLRWGPAARASRGAATRVGDPRSTRRNVNPSERRQRIALFGLAVLVAVGLVAVPILLAPGHARVPDLRGLKTAQARHRLSRAGLRVQLSHRYSDTAPVGSVMTQVPTAGTEVRSGTDVRLVLSAGPAPVSIPSLTGLPEDQARLALTRLRLRAAFVAAPRPGAPTGTVTAQEPPSGARRLPGSTVNLTVASAPRWRAVTSFTGAGSVVFRIRGSEWRLVYRMSYQGTCTWLFFCSGPSAQVRTVPGGATADAFALSDGGSQTRVQHAAPGLYQITVKPGSDTARWEITVEDRY